MKDQYLVKSLFGEGPLPGLQVAFFSLCLHMAKREKALSDCSSSCRILYDPHPRILETKAKINKCDLMKLKSFLFYRV